MTQKFKGDIEELKFDAAATAIMDELSTAKDEFFEGAYDAAPLGDLLHDSDRSPLANAIVLEIFRTSFNTIYQEFRVAGSFESYLEVFRKIFGEEVEVTFTVPDPGKLIIDIVAQDLEDSSFLARRVFQNAYVNDIGIWYDSDDEGDLLFQSVKGFKTQYELEQMLFEMVPAGVYTEITLTFGV